MQDQELIIGNSHSSIPVELVLVGEEKEIRIRCETDQEFARIMELIDEAARDEEGAIRERLGVSAEAAAKIAYLRTRSRWTQEKEDQLIKLDKAGQRLPHVYDGDF